MERLYVDCKRGLSSDMLFASLLQLTEKDKILSQCQDYIPKTIRLSVNNAKSYQNEGWLFSVDYVENCHKDILHHGYSLSDVIEVIEQTGFSKKVKNDALKVYDVLLDAECKAHNATRKDVHFHEVGRPASVYTILCVCQIMDVLKVDEIVFSEINVGFGNVQCSHGVIPVPAPATKMILKDIPTFSADNMKGELCTPTGAALAKVYAKSFETIYIDEYVKRGIGIGAKDFGFAGGVISYIL